MEEQKFIDSLFDEMFELFDTDKDGVIRAEDVKAYLFQTPHNELDEKTFEEFQFINGSTTTKAGAKLDVTLAYLAAYIKADKNKDKKIDVEEAIQYKTEHCKIKGMKVPSNEIIRQYFEKSDSDKDGYLGLSDFFEFIDTPMLF